MKIAIITFITFLSLNSKGSIITNGQDDLTIKIWDPESLEQLNSIKIRGEHLECNKLFSEDIIIAVLDRITIILINLENGSIISSVTLPSEIRDLSAVRNEILTSCDDGLLYRFEFIS